MNYLISYIRDADNRPIGAIAAVRVFDKLKPNINYGFSICHKNDRFNKALGRNLAIGRAVSEEQITLYDRYKLSLMTRALQNMQLRAKRYFK